MTLSLPADFTAMPGLRAARGAGRGLARSLERLSTGLRINRASDDPAALVLSEELRLQVSALRQGVENLRRGTGILQIADATVGQITDLLLRLSAIIVEASNHNLLTEAELDALQAEVGSILSGVDRLAGTTRFADLPLINGRLRKTAFFPLFPTNTNAVQVAVPAHSRIKAGHHRLVINKFDAEVVGLSALGVVGELGRITDEAGPDTQPEFNPAGTRIVYLDALGNIITRDSRDTDLPPAAPSAIAITGGAETGEDNPQFTPDGTRIIYEATTTGEPKIFRRAADGTGGATLMGVAGPNSNPDVGSPAVDLVGFEVPAPQSYPAPGGDVTGLAVGPGGTLFAVSNLSDTVTQFPALTGAPVTPLFALPAGDYGAMAFNPATSELYIVEHFPNPTSDVVRVFTLGGALVGSIPVGASVTTAGIAPPNPSTVDPGVLALTSGPTVSDSAAIAFAETRTMAFTSTPTPASAATFNITGSVTGLISSGTFTSGVPITAGGVTFTLTESPTPGTSVSGPPPVTTVTRSHMFVAVNGGPAVEVQFLASLTGGAAIAASIDAQVPNIAAVFTGANYTLTSDFAGTIASVAVTSGAPTAGFVTSAGGATFIPNTDTNGFVTSAGGVTFIADDGVSDQLTISVDGGPATTFDIATAGDLTTGADIAAAIDAIVPGVTATFDGTNYTITSDLQGTGSSVVVTGPALSAGDLLNLRAIDGATGVPGTSGIADKLTISVDGGPATTFDIAAGADLTTGADIAAAIGAIVPGVSATFSGGNYTVTSDTTGSTSSVVVTGGVGTAGDLLNLRAADGATEVTGFDDTAAILNLGVANGGTETGGTGVQSGDTFQYIVNGVGDHAAGLAFDGTNLRVGDGTLNRVYRWSTAGVMDTTYNLAVPATGLSGLDYHAPSDTYWLTDTSGNIRRVNATTGAIVETIGNPAPAPDNAAVAFDGTYQFISNLTTDLIYVAGTGIFTQPTGGGPATQISFQPGFETNVQFSGDGTKVTYQGSGGSIFVANSDGTGTVTIAASGASNPDLNFTGSLVAYDSGGSLLIANAATGVVTSAVAGAGDARFSPDGTRLLYESGGSIVVASITGGGVITGTVATFAGANGEFSPTLGGNRIVYENGGDAFVRFADGTTLSPLTANDGTVLTATGLFATAPFINTPNTVVDEVFSLTLVGDADGFDTWSVTGTISGAHTAYVVGTGLYTTDTTGSGGGGLSFELNPDGQYAVGDTILVTVDENSGASLDGGPFQPVSPFRTTTLISGEAGTLDVTFGPFIAGPSSEDTIVVEDATAFQGGRHIPDRVGVSIENMSSTFLNLKGIDVRNPFALEVAFDGIFSDGLTVAQLPTITPDATVDRSETIVISFTSPTSYDVYGSLSGLKSGNNPYVSGDVIDVDGVETILTGTAAANDAVQYEITKIHASSRVRQAVRWVAAARGELGSLAVELEALAGAKAVEIERVTAAESSLRDVDFADEMSRTVREKLILSSSINALSDALLSRAALLMLLPDDRPVSELLGRA